MTQLLTNDFINEYPDKPAHMNELAEFVFYRTYSRWLDAEGRRETWKEAVRRAVEYNVSISVDQFRKNGFEPPIDKIQMEAQALFDNIFNTRQFLSGRTHWVGGADTKVADKFPLANFNCSFINIKSWEDLSELFYLLLVGTGVGLKCTKEFAKNLAPLRTDIALVHDTYTPVPVEERLENTKFVDLENGYATIYVGDSKEGWTEALKQVLSVLTSDMNIHTLKVSYDSVRPRGERLKTFGGTASGHEPLRDMFQGIFNVIHNQIDPLLDPLEHVSENKVQPRPVSVLDMANLIGNNVVVGGVRRTALIFLADADDYESILAKYGINGIWDKEMHGKVIYKLNKLGEKAWAMKIGSLKLNDENARPLHHRRMSNNSVGFESKPSREQLNLLFTIMQGEGEPGFYNLEEARRRRPNAEGTNPCGEILLDSYGVCNLTTVNVDAFVYWVEEQEDEIDGTIPAHYELDYSGLMMAQALSARAGMRMTCLDLELPHWDAVHKRDRLIGTSLTGFQDAMAKLGYDDIRQQQLLKLLSENVHIEGVKYGSALRIPVPLLDTTVKPEGTLSQVAGGVSSGVHVSHAPYYIRRIRINRADPLAETAMALGWTVNPEVGQTWADANTLVIDFPVESGATRTKADQTVDDQFETYFMFQDVYTAHNTSNTISVKPDEWERAEEIVWEAWDQFCGVSFLAESGGSYALAPYEEITEEQYNELRSKMKPFDVEVLKAFEKGNSDENDAGNDGCQSGICPIR